MRCFIFGFVLGCYWGHQQAALYSVWAYLCTASMLGLLLYCRLQLLAIIQSAFIQCIVYFFAGVLLGLIWTNAYAAYVLKDALPHADEKKDITVIGVVDDLPAEDANRTQFTLQVESAHDQQKAIYPFPKRIQLAWYQKHRFAKKVNKHPPVLPGQRWQLTVRLKRPHGLVNPYKKDTEIHYIEKHIQASGYVVTDTFQLLTLFVFSVGHYIHHLRFLLKEKLHRQLSNSTYAGMMTALIIGDQSGITQDTWAIFRQTGISHLVAISGMHVMLVAGFLSKVIEWLWRKSFYTSLALPLILPAPKVRMISAVVIAAVYVVMAGLGIPAQRAFLMLFITAWGVLSGRAIPASILLSLALFVVLLFDPWALYSAGCWLSFMAVAILFYTRHANTSVKAKTRQLSDVNLIKKVKHYLMMWLCRVRQLCATQYVLLLGLFPVSIVVFGQYSMVSPVTNALAIPVVTLGVVPLLLLGCLLPDSLASVVWYGGHAILVWLMDCMIQCASWSWSMFYFVVPDHVTTAVALLGMVILFLPHGYPYRYMGWLGFFPFVFYPTLSPAQGDVWLTALDVGQGMALLIETAEHRLLYDTGGKLGDDSDAGKAVILPYLMARGINTLDTLLISHQDTDHSGGAKSILKEISVNHLLSSLPIKHDIHPLVPVSERCEAGQRWVWDSVQFEIFHPVPDDYAQHKIKPNALSCVLSVRAHGRQILLTGDIGKKQEKSIMQRFSPQHLRAWGLIAPHHGSNTSSSEQFLRAVNPAWTLFQMGYLNQFRHPHHLVLKRYQDLHIMLFRSDEHGAIQVKISADKADVNGVKKQSPHYWYQ